MSARKLLTARQLRGLVWEAHQAAWDWWLRCHEENPYLYSLNHDTYTQAARPYVLGYLETRLLRLAEAAERR